MISMRAPGVLDWMMVAAVSSLGPLSEVMMRSCPSAANTFASSRPMPLDEPVTSTRDRSAVAMIA